MVGPMGLEEITEAHERADKEQARIRYREAYRLCVEGEEALGVLAMYERAALDGCNIHEQLSIARMGVGLASHDTSHR